MSGICGVCQPGVNLTGTAVEPLAAVLSQTGASQRAFLVRRSAAFGVARRWENQQLAEVCGLVVAADADVLNRSELQAIANKEAPDIACSTTAELLGALYVARGINFTALIHGSFAIAIWDERNRRLVLALDRIGIANLYYTVEAGRVLFASRSGALAACTERTDVNRAALVESLIVGGIPAPQSVYAGIERLRPGHYVVFENGRKTDHCYWDLKYAEERGRSEAQWVAELREGMGSAVWSATDGYAPEQTGAYLSGGTDSSSVVAFLTKRHAPANSFSIWFEDPRFSEAEFANTTAKAFATRHFERCLQAEDGITAIPKITEFYDEPCTNSSAIGAYYCALLARENGMQVMLAGDGGDELFAGNQRYAEDGIFQAYHRVPSWIREGILERSAALSGWKKGLRYVRRANMPLPNRLFRRTLFMSMPAEHIFEPDLLREVPPETWLRTAESHFRNAQAESDLNRWLYMDVKITLADNDLRKVVGTAEMAGMRVRFPLLDHRLTELSARIPSNLKLKGKEKRYIFKRALTGVLPEKVLYKKKHGFGVPLSKWLLQDARLNSWMREVLHDPKSRQRGIFRSDFIDRLLQLHQGEHAAYYGEIVWYLLVLEMWYRRHVECPQSAVAAR